MAGKSEIAILVKMRDEASRTMGKMASNFERHAATIRKAGMIMAAAGAFLTVGLIAATKSAINQEIGIKRLDLVLQKVGTSYDEVGAEIEKEIRATQLATGVGDELQRQLLGTLTPILGDYKKAMAALPVVIDVAVFSQMGATTVARTLGSALAGVTNMSDALKLKFDENADFAERLKLVLDSVGGSAAVMKDPFQAAAGAIGDLSQAIGKPLIKPLTDALRWIENVTLAMSDMDPVLAKVVAIALSGAAAFATFAGAFLLLAPTIVKSLAILKSMAGVMAVLRALTGPVGIAIALASIGVGAAVMAAVKTFQFGGVVPGPVGQPQLAIVHGGETITPAGGGGRAQNVTVTIQGGPIFMTDERDMMRFATAISDAQRRRSQGTVGVNP